MQLLIFKMQGQLAYQLKYICFLVEEKMQPTKSTNLSIAFLLNCTLEYGSIFSLTPVLDALGKIIMAAVIANLLWNSLMLSKKEEKLWESMHQNTCGQVYMRVQQLVSRPQLEILYGTLIMTTTQVSVTSPNSQDGSSQV